jgi:cold shock protein
MHQRMSGFFERAARSDFQPGGFLLRRPETVPSRAQSMASEGNFLGMTGKRLSGIVKTFDGSKGYGFIEAAGTSQSVFVYYTSIVGDRYRLLRTGDKVEFAVEEAPQGPRAVEVTKL